MEDKFNRSHGLFLNPFVEWHPMPSWKDNRRFKRVRNTRLYKATQPIRRLFNTVFRSETLRRDAEVELSRLFSQSYHNRDVIDMRMALAYWAERNGIRTDQLDSVKIEEIIKGRIRDYYMELPPFDPTEQPVDAIRPEGV